MFYMSSCIDCSNNTWCILFQAPRWVLIASRCNFGSNSYSRMLWFLPTTCHWYFIATFSSTPLGYISVLLDISCWFAYGHCSIQHASSTLVSLSNTLLILVQACCWVLIASRCKSCANLHTSTVLCFIWVPALIVQTIHDAYFFKHRAGY